MNLDRRDLLVSVAHKYYVEKKSQEEISKVINCTRSNVSRLLKECLQEGIIEIKINYGTSSEMELQNKLKEKFNIKNIIVVPFNSDSIQIKTNLGMAGATYLKSLLKDGMTLGVAWTSLSCLLPYLKVDPSMKIDVVSMLGAISTGDINTDGIEAAADLARILNGKAYLLQSPLIVRNKIVRDMLLHEPEIIQVLEKTKDADVAVLGLGSNIPSVSSHVRLGYIDEAESKKLMDMGAVGDICGRQIDLYGNHIHPDFEERIVSIELQVLKSIPHRIGFAIGREKGQVILGALRGGHINALVIDEEAATEVLSLSEASEVSFASI